MTHRLRRVAGRAAPPRRPQLQQLDQRRVCRRRCRPHLEGMINSPSAQSNVAMRRMGLSHKPAVNRFMIATQQRPTGNLVANVHCRRFVQKASRQLTVASISSMSGSGSLAASQGMTRSSSRSGIARRVRHTCGSCEVEYAQRSVCPTVLPYQARHALQGFAGIAGASLRGMQDTKRPDCSPWRAAPRCTGGAAAAGTRHPPPAAYARTWSRAPHPPLHTAAPSAAPPPWLPVCRWQQGCSRVLI